MRKLGTAISITSIFLVTILVDQAHAGSPKTHDGLFLHLSAGAGGAQTEIKIPGLNTELSGGSTDLNFAIGAVIAPNLALHGTLFGWLVSDPEGTIQGLGSATVSGDLDLTAYGGGLTYYFMPVNIYLSGSVGAGELTADTPSGSAETDTGIVGEFSVGKEWWVGGSWGLGVSGSFGFHSIPDGGVDENWSGTSWAIRFSATMN